MPELGMTIDGRWVAVEDDVANVVRTITETWPMLVIQVFEGNPEPGDAPYQIVERLGNKDYPVMDVWELDYRVVERLHRLDRQRRGVETLDDIILRENNERRKKLAEPWEERKQLGEDLIVHMGKNPKTSYTFKDPDTGETHKVSDG